jgi:biotin carboxyl carrier protein
MGDGSAKVNGKDYSVNIKEGSAESAAPAASGGATTDIKAQMPGVIIRVEVGVGDAIGEGDVVLVMEAMKMEVEVKSPAAGTVSAVEVSVGDQVQSGSTLVSLG